MINATGEEFKWEFIQTSIQANIELVEKVGIVTLVECYFKLSQTKSFNMHIGVLLLAKYFVSGLVFKTVDNAKPEEQWTQLMYRAAFCVVFVQVCK